MDDHQDYRELFQRLVNQPDADIDLVSAALYIAATFQFTIDLEGSQRQLKYLVEAARFRVRTADDIDKVTIDLVSFLHNQQGFSGNTQDYYDPANSYFDQVLLRRKGIPITLALVYLVVAGQLGLEMHGIGFPGHFLLKLVREKNIIIDPFFGRQLSSQECVQMMVRAGYSVDHLGLFMQPATSREILARILNNLKTIFYQRKNYADSLTCVEWRLILDPRNSQDFLEQGAILEHMGRIHQAISAYETLLALAPEAEVRRQVEQKLAGLISRYRQLH